MRNYLWTWILMGSAIVLIGGYGLLRMMSSEPPMPMPPSPLAPPVASAPIVTAIGGNPLLTADKIAVTRWFPGHCFAEIYNKEPSFGGRLIPSCIADVIQHVRADTGITLTEKDIYAPAVLSHFKQVYGNDDLWRQ